MRPCVGALAILVLAGAVLGCQDSGPEPTEAPKAVQPQIHTAKPPTSAPETPAVTDDPQPTKLEPPKTQDTQPADDAKFVLPQGYDEAEAGLQQGDKDLMKQAMAVLPPADFDAQAIRVIVAAALGDKDAIARESAQLHGAGAPPSFYSKTLSEIAHSVTAENTDWKKLDDVADALNTKKGCILAYDALALFAAKTGDMDRAGRYRQMAKAHAGEDG